MTRCILAQTFGFYGVNIPPLRFCEFRNEMQNAVELQYIPATIFLNKDGDIVGKPVVGALDAEGWLAEIEGRLKELE